MTMPNFFIIGAQKAGTTSLYHYLTQHPQIYMSPVKEPYFFDHEINPGGEIVKEKFEGPGGQKAPRFSDIEEYRTLFRAAKGETVIGEASTPYLYARGTAERIERYVPGAKAIALLRNPADRAYSAFLHAVRIGREPLTDFAHALKEEENRVRANWHYNFHYRAMGFYYPQLKRYYDTFGPERVGVWLYDDLREDPTRVTQSIFGFLGVDDAFVPDTSSKHNPSGVPKNGLARAVVKAMDKTASGFLETFTSSSRAYPLLSRMRRRVQSRIVAKPPSLDQKFRTELIEGYKEDIMKLQGLIERDLSVWLNDGEKRTTRRVNTRGLSS